MAFSVPHSILDTIGRTPLLEVEGILVKCEFFNPSGSIKPRVARALVEDAEKRGLLRPGDTLVEATSGNMGNALAMMAAAKGYRMIVLMPSGFSNERVALSRALGAEVRFIGDFHLNEAVEMAKRLGQQKGFFCPLQFENPLNIEESCFGLGREILSQLPEGVRVDAVVQGVGTGGTLIGVGKAIRSFHNPEAKLFAVEPAECTTLKNGRVGHHLIEGISDGFVPALFEQHRGEVNEIVEVTSGEAIAGMKALAKERGLLVGPSSGANFIAAQRVRQRYPDLRVILTFFCDEAEKYLQQHYTART